MFTTDNQNALKAELDLMFEEQGAAFAAGYLNSMAQEMLNLLPNASRKSSSTAWSRSTVVSLSQLRTV
jgi:hypothetical protein